MARSGILLACLGLLVCSAAARLESIVDSIEELRGPGLEGIERFLDDLDHGVGSRKLHQYASNMGEGLVAAAAKGDAPMVKKLLDAGADPNYLAGKGKYSALLVATAENHADVVQLLLEAGAQVDLEVGRGATALHYGVWQNSVEAVRVLLSGGADPNEVMFMAVAESGGDMLLTLIQGGGDVNLESDKGLTVLVLAAYLGNQEAIEVLLENGADKSGSSGLVPMKLVCQCMTSEELQKVCRREACESPQDMISMLTPTH